MFVHTFLSVRSFFGCIINNATMRAKDYQPLIVAEHWSYLAEWSLTIVHAIWVSALSVPTCRGPTKWFLSLKPLRYVFVFSLLCLMR